MTENAIVEKLQIALSDAVDNECKVVYILAETRKLLETYPPDPMPFALKLYCHWALHVNLENPSHTLPFLERVDKYAASLLIGREDIAEGHRMLREFVSLDTFRQQFAQFLKAFRLPTGICDDNPRWHEFLKHYASVIEDGSLSLSYKGKSKAKAHPLKLVKQVIFTKGRTAAPEENFYIPFGLAWTIVLLGGKRLTVEVKASAPNGDETISAVATLH